MINKSLDESANILKIINSAPDVFKRLQAAKKPIALYGMGNGALKIINACKKRRIEISAIFASDEFVRGHSFLGFPVLTLKQVEEKLGDFIVLLGFGSSLPGVLEKFHALNARYELYAPDVPLAGDPDEIFDRGYALKHLNELERAYSLLADEQSKKVFLSVLQYKLSGKIDFLTDCETPRDEMFDIIKPGENEFYIDLGAYNGDTVSEFISKAESCRQVIAVEPDVKNFRKLCKNAGCPPLPGIENMLYVNAPVWDEPVSLLFDNKASRGSCAALPPNGSFVKAAENAADAVTVDKLLRGELPASSPAPPLIKGGVINNATYIKADVEGAEARALNGAKQTIKAFSPRLTVSAYHRNDDLFILPALIKKLDPEYKLYLRHHPYIPAWETNLYAVK